MWLKDTVAQTDEESWVIAVKQVGKVRGVSLPQFLFWVLSTKVSLPQFQI